MDVPLLPPQWEFLKAKQFETMYTGAFGAGKSRALCYKLIMHAAIPGNFVGLCRKKHTSLRQTTLRTLLMSEGGLPPCLPLGSYSYNKSEQLIKLHGGGEIFTFGFDDWRKVGSLNFGAVGVDEATELDEEEYNMLLGRIRNPADPNRQIFLATNPDSPGHFLYKRFLEKRHPRRKVIHTTTLDNWYLPKDYVETLLTLEGAALQRYVYGKWVAFEGAVYPMFTDEHVVDMPLGAEFFIGIDWGFSQPLGLLLICHLGDGRLHVVDEIYQKGLVPARITEIVSALCAKHDVYLVSCDPSEPAMIEMLNQAEIPADGADNDVMAGIRLVQEHFSKGLLTISPGCEHLRKELQSYQWQDGKDKPIKAFDHLVDSLRYAIMGWTDGIITTEKKSFGRSPSWHPPQGEDW